MFKINYREPLAKEVSGSFYLKRTNSALNLHTLLSRLPTHVFVKRIHRAGKFLVFQARKYFVCAAVGKNEHGAFCDRTDLRLKVAELDDDDTRIYFPLRKGKTSGIISTNYRLPCTTEDPVPVRTAQSLNFPPSEIPWNAENYP